MQEGIRDVREGRMGDAYKVFKKVIERNPRNEFAWIWISVTSEDRTHPFLPPHSHPRPPVRPQIRAIRPASLKAKAPAIPPGSVTVRVSVARPGLATSGQTAVPTG